MDGDETRRRIRSLRGSSPEELLDVLGNCGALEGFDALISPLQRYDRDHNSDLVHTLRVFFQANANASEAADRLFLHRNSMAYRLERVQSLVGLDLRDPKVRLALQLGLLSTEVSMREKRDETRDEGSEEDAAKHP